MDKPLITYKSGRDRTRAVRNPYSTRAGLQQCLSRRVPQQGVGAARRAQLTSSRRSGASRHSSAPRGARHPASVSTPARGRDLHQPGYGVPTPAHQGTHHPLHTPPTLPPPWVPPPRTLPLLVPPWVPHCSVRWSNAGSRAHLRILRRLERVTPDCQPVLVGLAG